MTHGCDLEGRQWFLKRDFVSHGCMRLESEDIVDMLYTILPYPSVPVTTIPDAELDAAGNVVDLGTDVRLWEVGASIAYGECGVRPDPYSVDVRWTSTSCG